VKVAQYEALGNGVKDKVFVVLTMADRPGRVAFSERQPSTSYWASMKPRLSSLGAKKVCLNVFS